jgi:hypothetical protein
MKWGRWSREQVKLVRENNILDIIEETRRKAHYSPLFFFERAATSLGRVWNYFRNKSSVRSLLFFFSVFKSTVKQGTAMLVAGQRRLLSDHGSDQPVDASRIVLPTGKTRDLGRGGGDE